MTGMCMWSAGRAVTLALCVCVMHLHSFMLAPFGATCLPCVTGAKLSSHLFTGQLTA